MLQVHSNKQSRLFSISYRLGNLNIFSIVSGHNLKGGGTFCDAGCLVQGFSFRQSGDGCCVKICDAYVFLIWWHLVAFISLLIF